MFFSYDNGKIALVGCNATGMAYAFSLCGTGLCKSLVLLDVDAGKAWGEAQDMGYACALCDDMMTVYNAGYEECIDADIVVLCAEPTNPRDREESESEYLQRLTNLYTGVVNGITDSGFCGIILVACEPSDIMTRVVYDLCSMPATRVIGLGNIAEEAWIKHRMGEYFGISKRHIHLPVIGGRDREMMTAWSKARIGSLTLGEKMRHTRGTSFLCDISRMAEDNSVAAESIRAAKGEYIYGRAMALKKLTEAIVKDENKVFTVAQVPEAEQGYSSVCMTIPCVINRDGVAGHEMPKLGEEEREYLDSLCRKKYHLYAALNYHGKRRNSLFMEN